jgi:PAS domain S-box-containing protein
VLLFDVATGTLLEANDFFLHMFDYRREDVAARALTWRTMTPPEYVAVSERQLETFAATGRIGPYEKEYLRRDGSRSWMVFAGAALGDGTVVEYCIDIDDRKQAEAALRDREAWLRGQREALGAGLNGAPLEASLGVLVRTAADGLGRDTRAAFYLADGEGTSLHHVVGMPPAYAEAVDGFKIGPESLACGLATHTGRPVLTRDVTKDPRWEPWRWLAQRFDYRGCWSFPIHTSAGKFVGTFAVYSRQPRQATERDLELASLLTHTASMIIAHHTELEARQQAEQALSENDERLQLALAAARMGTWSWEVAADRHRRDANLNRLLGLEPAETVLPIAEFFTHVHPEDRDTVRKAFDTSVRQSHNLQVEFRVVLPRGEVRWLRDQGDVFGGPADRHLAGACLDITGLKEAESLQRANDELEGEMDRRRDLARRLSTAQEDERRRVARDLHDSVGQLLAGLSLAVKAVAASAPLPAPAAERLAVVQRVADELGRQVHGLAVRLRPTALDDFGLAAALGQLVGEWSAQAGVPVDLQTVGLESGRLPPAAETALYRVVQEALTNVARHARANSVSVVVSRHDGQATAVVEDDGVGFDLADAGAGRLGLIGMRERVALAGGNLDIESEPGRGTTVIARVPMGPATEGPGREEIAGFFGR